MVVLFVVLTFAVFIALDYILHRDKYALELREEAVIPAQAPARAFEPVYVDGVTMIPSLKYHPAHSWAAVEGTANARIGVDEFAGRLLGHVDRVDMPPAGRWIRQGERAFSVYHEGRKLDVIAPIEGEVLSVNAKLAENPDELRNDPYGEGWVMVVHSPDLATSVRNLLSGSLARRWMEDSVARLRRLVAPAEPALAQEAGPLHAGLSADWNDALYRTVVKEFFLN